MNVKKTKSSKKIVLKITMSITNSYTTPNWFLSQTPACNVKGVADPDKNGVPDPHS